MTNRKHTRAAIGEARERLTGYRMLGSPAAPFGDK